MSNIQERAHKYACQEAGGHYDGGLEGMVYEGSKEAYIKIATEQRLNDYWKSRKAFCIASCGENCPLVGESIEGGGDIVVDCKKLEKFCNLMTENI